MMLSPSDFRPTCRSQVESWEIDQNGHWSARFFVRSLQTALDWLLALGPAPEAPQRLLHRHMRFHRELFVGEPVEAGSAVLSGNGAHVAHAIWNGDTGELCATGTDVLSQPIASLPRLGPEQSAHFTPRSLSLEPIVPIDTASLLSGGAATVCYRGVVRPAGSDDRGALLPHEIHGYLSEGQGATWKHAGISAPLLARHEIGRVLVEMAMTSQEPAAAGEPVELVAWFDRLLGKVFAIRFQLNRSTDDMPLASVSTIGVFIDKKTRKSIALPREFADRISRHVIRGPDCSGAAS